MNGSRRTGRSSAFLAGAWRTMILSGAALAVLATTSRAAGPRVLPPGESPNDRRLGELKDLNGYFPFHPPESREEWAERSKQLRRRILVSAGLWPMPDKTPLHAVIHGRAERDGFTVEKVFFESYPGHYVTGLLFRPEGRSGRGPAVLCPHGHGGRLQDLGVKGVREQIVQGAERFEASGRFPKLARCGQLARMGCVTFIFDMVGYVDSVQIPRAVAHGFKKQRPEMDQPDSWGFFSTQAELRVQNILGLQLYNGIRALDFLCELPDVDPQRLGVTGGSGGGTQTILLGAVDPRPVVTFPQGMVSTAMQGGCTCENASCLRIGTGNVELAALMAPKPLAMTAANDWTKEMMTKGYPELLQLYEMLGVKKNVLCRPFTHFHHNYNYVTRAVMYSWMNQHLKLGLEEPIVEEDWRPLTPEEYTVWDEDHPRPPDGEDYERSLTRYMDQESQRQLAALAPTDEESLARYREIVGGAFDTLVGGRLATDGEIQAEEVARERKDGYVQLVGWIRRPSRGEELPAVALLPEEAPRPARVVVWADGEGKSGLFGPDGSPRPEVRRLLSAGAVVLAADLLGQGELVSDGQPMAQNRVVSNPREAAAYTFGYNDPLLAQRAHDILTLISFARSDEVGAERVDLVGVRGAGVWAAAARAQAGGAIDSAAIDTGGFRFRTLQSYRDANFLPGAVKYGDTPGLLSLSAPGRLWIAGEQGEVPPLVAAAYRAAGKQTNVTSFSGAGGQVARAAVDWLLEE